MLVLFMGPTASGKTSLLNFLCDRYASFEPVVRVTTRPMRAGEIDGKDYSFVSLSEFARLYEYGELVELEEYSDQRYYGTTKASLISKPDVNLCSTITPSGLLQICLSKVDYGEILVVNCNCSMRTQLIRYVNRIKDFSVSEKLEVMDRLARDEGMFKGIDSIISAAKELYCGRFFSVNLDTESDLDTCFKTLKPVLGSILMDEVFHLAK